MAVGSDIYGMDGQTQPSLRNSHVPLLDWTGQSFAAGEDGQEDVLIQGQVLGLRCPEVA